MLLTNGKVKPTSEDPAPQEQDDGGPVDQCSELPESAVQPQPTEDNETGFVLGYN